MNDAFYMAHAINDIAAIAGGIVDTSSYIVSSITIQELELIYKGICL